MEEISMYHPAWWNHVVDQVKAFHLANTANLPGAVLAVETQQDGRLISNLGKGWANDTICEIGSMTKPFISAAVLLALEERGMLDIEVPVWKLPGMDLYCVDPTKRQVRL